jgi:hypothetical protein
MFVYSYYYLFLVYFNYVACKLELIASVDNMFTE